MTSRYSNVVMDHFSSPRNWGRLDAPDRVGVTGVPGRSGYLVLHLSVSENLVVQARFQSHQCGATVASGSVLTELIVGRTLDQCRTLESDELLSALGGLPPDKAHCAGMAMRALREALESPDV